MRATAVLVLEDLTMSQVGAARRRMCLPFTSLSQDLRFPTQKGPLGFVRTSVPTRRTAPSMTGKVLTARDRLIYQSTW